MHEPGMTTEERIRLLEEHVHVQELLLVGLQAERIEAERLNESVTRLGMGATSLGEALLQVDRQQQLLTRLGKEVAAVQQKAAAIEEKTYSKEELAELEAAKEAERAQREAEAEAERVKKEKALAARERDRRRKRNQQVTAWTVGGLAVLITGVLASMVSNAADEREEARFRQDVYNICEARAEQARKIRQLIEREPPETSEAAQTRELILSAFPVIPCEGLLQ